MPTYRTRTHPATSRVDRVVDGAAIEIAEARDPVDALRRSARRLGCAIARGDVSPRFVARILERAAVRSGVHPHEAEDILRLGFRDARRGRS